MIVQKGNRWRILCRVIGHRRIFTAWTPKSALTYKTMPEWKTAGFCARCRYSWFTLGNQDRAVNDPILQVAQRIAKG